MGADLARRPLLCRSSLVELRGTFRRPCAGGPRSGRMPPAWPRYGQGFRSPAVQPQGQVSAVEDHHDPSCTEVDAGDRRGRRLAGPGRRRRRGRTRRGWSPTMSDRSGDGPVHRAGRGPRRGVDHRRRGRLRRWPHREPAPEAAAASRSVTRPLPRRAAGSRTATAPRAVGRRCSRVGLRRRSRCSGRTGHHHGDGDRPGRVDGRRASTPLALTVAAVRKSTR